MGEGSWGGGGESKRESERERVLSKGLLTCQGRCKTGGEESWERERKRKRERERMLSMGLLTCQGRSSEGESRT